MSPSLKSQPQPVIVSAPGKVLLAGGYLVLDRKYRGLVVGLDARIHVCVRKAEGNEVEGSEGGKGKGVGVVVRSPQFVGAEWAYWCETVREGEGEGNGNENGGWARVRQVESSNSSAQSHNPFVETTLTYVLTYLSHLKINLTTPLSITILADNDYYSQPSTSTPDHRANTVSPKSKSRFTTFRTTLSSAHKTGLGSSAALVTALTSALFSFYLNLSTTPQLELRSLRLHNLSQAAHCAAQGKVGSGFDVAAAIYGSTLYRRFSPVILENVGEPGSPGFGERLHRCVEDLSPDPGLRWDVEVGRRDLSGEGVVEIPKGLRLVMCDVDCGSQTPGMVKKVLEWRRKNEAEAEVLWAALQQGTEELCQELREISSREKGDVAAISSSLGMESQPPQGLRDMILAIRSLVREMSEKSGVPIEPDVQTELIDACMEIEGVVGGVVPGAGGYDAVALLVRNEDTVLERLQKRLEGWKSSSGGEGGAMIGNVKLLGVKQEKEGVRVEEVKEYGEWLA